MVNFNALRNINEIKNAKEGNNDIFSQEEKLFFSDPLVMDVGKAREVAKLIVKVQEARSGESESLLNSLQEEKVKNNGRGSLAFKVVNRDNLIDNAITLLQMRIENTTTNIQQ